ncbi:uncharacterized protein METZ01_LOCUS356082, partial [marine metagenome]
MLGHFSRSELAYMTTSKMRLPTDFWRGPGTP